MRCKRTAIMCPLDMDSTIRQLMAYINRHNEFWMSWWRGVLVAIERTREECFQRLRLLDGDDNHLCRYRRIFLLSGLTEEDINSWQSILTRRDLTRIFISSFEIHFASIIRLHSCSGCWWMDFRRQKMSEIAEIILHNLWIMAHLIACDHHLFMKKNISKDHFLLDKAIHVNSFLSFCSPMISSSFPIMHIYDWVFMWSNVDCKIFINMSISADPINPIQEELSGHRFPETVRNQ